MVPYSYSNHKKFFSIVLLAIVDANYKFMVVDVGAYGREGDSAIISTMGKKIITGDLNFPEPRNFSEINTKLNHFLIGDEAFALDSRIDEDISEKNCQKWHN